jgi:polyisoprenoid-binding protein YceI
MQEGLAMLGRSFWCSILIAIAAATLTPCAQSSGFEYAIDPGRTVVTFEMRSLGTEQRGQFSGATGKVTLDFEAGTGAIDIVIDARSLQAGSERVSKFVRGPAMLDTQAHPDIAYKGERIVFAERTPVRIEGKLTLLGVSRAVPLAVTRYDCTDGSSAEQQRCSMVATASVRRSAFGMNRYLTFASDEVKFAIKAEGLLIE